jgi:hypothetical protein
LKKQLKILTQKRPNPANAFKLVGGFYLNWLHFLLQNSAVVQEKALNAQGLKIQQRYEQSQYPVSWFYLNFASTITVTF